MKKVNFKKFLITVSAVFALLFIGVEKADAQTITSSGITNSGAVNFLSSAEAQTVLLNEIADLKNSTQFLVPGTPLYVAIKKTALYYHGIYTELVVGKAVAQAIDTGLGFVNNTSDDALNSSELMTLRLGAVDLLQ